MRQIKLFDPGDTQAGHKYAHRVSKDWLYKVQNNTGQNFKMDMVSLPLIILYNLVVLLGQEQADIQ